MVFLGRLARGVDDRGLAPETPVKGGIAIDNPGFAMRMDCDRFERFRFNLTHILAAPQAAGFLFIATQG
jgi:hypothetical protein